jgi:flagellar hook protein FlgE
MGIYGALATAVTGLRAQSFALENISGNIANSQTSGYKRIETSFIDLIPDAPVKQQIPGSVLAQSRGTVNEAGDVVSSSNDTYMALNGSGFFVVEQSIGQNDGKSIFGGASYYTRRGDFDIDREGYLVNGAGYYLKGLDIDAGTGNVSGSVPAPIQLSNAFLPAQQTNRLDYQLNLPQLPKNSGYDAASVNSELMNPVDYGEAVGAQVPTVEAQENAAFLSNSIAGGAITVYASNGSPANVQIRWAKVDQPSLSGPDKWNMFYMTDSAATGADTMWTNAGQDYTFDPSGSMSPSVTSTTLTGLNVNGVVIGDLVLQHNSGGVTQFADANGSAQVTALSQNGYPAGEFISVTINDSGRVVASYTNGQQIEVAQVVVANFNAPNSMKRLDGGLFAATSESGEAILGGSGGILGGALESSNTDISEEFTKLIVTQQAYTAGTRIVSTADEMLKEALNMVR